MTVVEIWVNGKKRSYQVQVGVPLVDFLRDTLRLTGTKTACSIGICGLCTVLMNGKAVSSCLMPVEFAHGKHVVTIEGLGAITQGSPYYPDPELVQAVQESFILCEGFQCGICTPGQVMTTVALLMENPTPTEEDVRHYLSGNLCRCTGYQSIVDSVLRAADRWEGTHADVFSDGSE